MQPRLSRSYQVDGSRSKRRPSPAPWPRADGTAASAAVRFAVTASPARRCRSSPGHSAQARARWPVPVRRRRSALGQGDEHRLAVAPGELRGTTLHGLEVSPRRSRHPSQLRRVHLEAKGREMVTTATAVGQHEQAGLLLETRRVPPHTRGEWRHRFRATPPDRAPGARQHASPVRSRDARARTEDRRASVSSSRYPADSAHEAAGPPRSRAACDRPAFAARSTL